MLSFEDVVAEISKASNLEEAEVRRLIEEKQDELSGLVSPEGAAYIVGKELGVNLLKEVKRGLNIGNIVSGMRSVDITAKVIRVFDKRDFESKGRKGSVANILLGDETGKIRLSLWDNEIGKLGSLGISEGTVVSVHGGFVKEDNKGLLELRLGKFGSMETADVEITVGEDRQDRAVGRPAEEHIANFSEGGMYHFRGTFIQVFRRAPFYEVCPQCGGKLSEAEGKTACKEHGEVDNPAHAMILSGVVDDGSGNIRVVFFRDMAERVAGKKADEMFKIFQKSGIDKYYSSLDVVGKELRITGRVKRNEVTESLEVVASEVREADVKDEVGRLLEGLGKN